MNIVGRGLILESNNVFLIQPLKERTGANEVRLFSECNCYPFNEVSLISRFNCYPFNEVSFFSRSNCCPLNEVSLFSRSIVILLMRSV